MSTAAERRWYQAVAELETCSLCRAYGVQWSHSNMLRGKSQKSAPHNSAALCEACHFEIDNGRDLSQLERRELHFRAITLTHDRLIEAGRLVLK
jgi:hypothetical protein